MIDPSISYGAIGIILAIVTLIVATITGIAKISGFVYSLREETHLMAQKLTSLESKVATGHAEISVRLEKSERDMGKLTELVADQRVLMREVEALTKRVGRNEDNLQTLIDRLGASALGTAISSVRGGDS